MSEQEALETIRGGAPLCYGYDVYGSGRVRFTISWDAEAQTFVEERSDLDMGGNTYTTRGVIDEETVLRHVRSAQQP